MFCFFVYFVGKIVDAFCTSRVNLSGPKAAEVVLAWTLRFCSLGGVGHLVSSLKVHAHRFAVWFWRDLVVLVWCGLGLALVWWWLDLLSWVLGRGFSSVTEGGVMGWSSGECFLFVCRG